MHACTQGALTGRLAWEHSLCLREWSPVTLRGTWGFRGWGGEVGSMSMEGHNGDPELGGTDAGGGRWLLPVPRWG